MDNWKECYPSFIVHPQLEKRRKSTESGLVYAGDIYPSPQAGRIAVSFGFTITLALVSAIGLYHLLYPCHRKKQGQTADSQEEVGSLWRTPVGLGMLILAGVFPVVLIGRMSELYTYGSSPFYALLLGVLVAQGLRAVRSSGLWKGYAFRGILMVLLAGMGWLAYDTHEKVARAVDLSDRAKGYFGQVVQWLDGMPEDPVTLCWHGMGREEAAYSGFYMPDRVISRGVVAFASTLRSRSVEYVEESPDAGGCDYEAFVGEDGLHIVQRAVRPDPDL